MMTFTPSRSTTTYVRVAGRREISGFLFSTVLDLRYSNNELESSLEMQHITEHGIRMLQTASKNEDV